MTNYTIELERLFNLLYAIEIICLEENVPRDRVQKLIERAYQNIYNRDADDEIASLLAEIVKRLKEYLDRET